MVDFRRDVFGRASALETGVDRESFVAARSAERVPVVPIKEMSGFRIDGSCVVSVTRSQRRVRINER